MSVVDIERLREIAEVEFVELVTEAIIPDANELRILRQFCRSLVFVEVARAVQLSLGAPGD